MGKVLIMSVLIMSGYSRGKFWWNGFNVKNIENLIQNLNVLFTNTDTQLGPIKLLIWEYTQGLKIYRVSWEAHFRTWADRFLNFVLSHSEIFKEIFLLCCSARIKTQVISLRNLTLRLSGWTRESNWLWNRF